jgi:tRNA uridine 5-carboxymethylaminomethyl modification enzyme
VGPERAIAFQAKAKVLEEVRTRVAGMKLGAAEAARAGFAITPDGQTRSLPQLLTHRDIDLGALERVWPEIATWPDFAREQVEIDAAYHGYLDRQEADIDRFRRDEALVLPEDLDYRGLAGLSNEAVERLSTVRPRTLGQAARIEGLTPSAITALLSHVRRRAA